VDDGQERERANGKQSRTESLSEDTRAVESEQCLVNGYVPRIKVNVRESMDGCVSRFRCAGKRGASKLTK
jgi:hypothetical protein